MADWAEWTGVAEVEVEPSGQDRLARLISNVFNPATLALPMLLLGVYESHQPGAWRYAALYALIGVLVPMLDFLWQMRAGHVSDIHLANRSERYRVFVVSILCSTLGLAILHLVNAPPLIVALAQAAVLQGTVLFVITLRWQISIHTAMITSAVTFMLLAFGHSALAFVLLIPLVAWARVHLNRHTAAQVVAGAIVGATCMLLSLAGVLY